MTGEIVKNKFSENTFNCLNSEKRYDVSCGERRGERKDEGTSRSG